ncbi:MAG TPA: FxLYD domain-containing protein [Patescibacteria group bacterium]|nr:FxLYD domain-containing protein [Patescibacteria group bacterium]
MTNVSRAGRSGRLPRLLVAGLALLAALTIAPPVGAEVNSARYKFEGNKWLSLDLAVDEVRTDVIRFDWPSAVLGVKSGYKAVVKVVNSSTKQVSAGLAVALYDGDGKLLGAGTTGTKIGTIDPGDSAEFTVSFDHVIERLSQTTQFQIALQTR